MAKFFARTAAPGEEVIELNCPCDTTPVLVLSSAVESWRCTHRHKGTETGVKYRLTEPVLTLETYHPSLMERAD